MQSGTRTPLYHLDLFTGIGGFHLAAKRVGIETIMSSEVDSFNIKFIEQNLGLENCGDISLAACNRDEHPYTEQTCKEDMVPVEKTGITSLCYEDFMEGILPWPDIVSGGFPCQDISSANTQGCSVGINGKRSGLVNEQLRIIESLEPSFAVFENSKNLRSRGLDYILSELNNMGYIVEFETISAVPFGYPHYRHRMFVIAYLPSTQIACKGVNIFDEVRKNLKQQVEFKIPLLNTNEQDIKSKATVSEPRSIKLRTKRINGLGNSVIPDIPEAIYRVISKYEKEDCSASMTPKQVFNTEQATPPELYTLRNHAWGREYQSTFTVETKMPTRGLVFKDKLYSTNTNDPIFNPSTSLYKDLYYTLGRKDGNNNGNPSRATRPGGLGGLNGQLGGALNPEWCEPFMGYPVGYTELD